jgi:lipopolysaccharide export system protein LptA
VHANAAEAELRKSTGEVLFRGTGTGAPRLWQGANSIAAPVILLNRLKQTLVATSTTAATPVRTVLIRTTPEKPAEKSKSATPSVIRLRSGELRYSEGERLALLKAGSAATVTAETTGQDGAATVNAQEAEIRLLPAGVHSGASGSSGNTSVDQMTARGHVVVDWPGRRGTGEKLVYQSESSNFTLTGTSAVRPRITDQLRGTVTGNALIFHSRDDSVTVEGDGTKTVTETQSPK